MATAGCTPLKGQDGNYQVRIESYDPARNTMKAIWLVSRNQRLLSQLLEKCEVSNNETSNEARGNLLSVQRELQEIRDAMDRHDGTQTPVLNASCIAMGNDYSSMFLGRGAEDGYSLPPTPVPAEDLFQAERASSGFGFGSHRKKSVLSQIPKRPRPSIRTDFCVSTFDPFPAIRARPSKIPSPPPVKKKRKGKKNTTLLRSKTSLGGRNAVGRYAIGGRVSSLKGIPMSARPATSMALTRSMTKAVSFGDRTGAKLKQPRRKTPMEKKYAKENVRPATSLGIRSTQRVITSSASNSSLGTMSGRRTSVGLNSGRRSSLGVQSGISSVGSSSRRSSGLISGGSNTGRLSSMGLNTGRRSVAEQTSERKRTLKTEPLTHKAKGKILEKEKGKVKGQAGAQLRRSESKKSRGSSYSELHLANKEKSKKKIEAVSVNSRGIRSIPVKKSESKRIRPASAMPTVLPEVLPFESPPPAPKLISQPCSLGGSVFSDHRREDTASPVIRSISIIDDASEASGMIDDTRRTLPRIRVGDGDQQEYKVKAYFLDDEIDDFPTPPVLNSGVIPSSPVEVDSANARDHHLSRAETVTTGSNNAPFKNSAKHNKEAITTKEKRDAAREPETPFALDLGSDYLPEFESEVHGLLDTLMSQDLLTSSFSQDLRLFSTESNFMDEEQSKIERGDNKLDAREVDWKEKKSPREETGDNQHPAVKSGELPTKGYGASLVDETENNDFTARETPQTSGIRSGSSIPLHGEKFQKTPIGDALRRKSTGSYDATTLSKSVAAAVKPERHRRSASQSELDAMLTNNDGYPSSPGLHKRGQCCNGQDCLYCTETCSVLSSSELTLPDPCETYYDVHHGYTPSFSMIPDPNHIFRKSSSLGKSNEPSPRVERGIYRGSFDFFNRRSSQEHRPFSPAFRYDTVTTTRLASTADEIEDLSTSDKQTIISKDRYLKTTSSYSAWDGRQSKDTNSRMHQGSSNDSEQGSVIHVAQDTDEDTVEDIQGGSSADGSLGMKKISRSHSSIFRKSPKKSQPKPKHKWSCGFIRLLSCTSSLETVDNN